MAFEIPQTRIQTGAERKTQKTTVKYFKLCKPGEQKGVKKLTVTNLVNIDVTVDKIKELQTTDDTLKTYRDLAKSGKKKLRGEGIDSWFSIEKELLYRHF